MTTGWRFKALTSASAATTLAFYALGIAETISPHLIYQKNGTTANQALGFHVADGGDINGDGTADFIISTTFSQVYVYSGADGTLLYAVGGSTIAGIGDINGDNKSDFITALPGTPTGTAYIFSGANGQFLYSKQGTASGDGFGWSIGGTGDVNGDDRADFIIGAEFADSGSLMNAGAAYVYSGATGQLLFQEFGSTAYERFGWSVSGAGDLNGDGFADFLVGAPLARPNELFLAGSVYAFSGANGELLFRKDGKTAEDNLGYSVAGLGDIDGDGKSDFIVGVFLSDSGGLTNNGSAIIYSGATGSILYQEWGGESFDGFGQAVAAAGDVDGDGTNDFLIGAYLADPNGLADAGSAYVYSGKNGSLLFQIDGDSAGHQLGRDIGGGGDMNQDGRRDFIFAAPGANPNGLLNAGSVYVYGLLATNAKEEEGNRPVKFWLSQNFPNPFNPSTTIHYRLAQREKVTLEIFNLLGERVKVPLDEDQSAGEHTISWDGKDRKGKVLPSGIYLYRLTTKDYSETKKMLLLK